MKEVFKKYDIYWLAGIASLVISLVMFAWQQPISLDAIMYTKAAEAFLNGGVRQAMAVYPWPAYSILLAMVAKYFHLSFLTAGYVLDVFFDTGVVLAFIVALEKLGASRRTLLIGAFIILFFPFLNHYRDTLLRDHGYYFFSLLAFLFFSKYLERAKIRYSLFWGVTILLAGIFRIEGFIYAALIPFAVFFLEKRTLKQKAGMFLSAYFAQAIATLFFLFFVLLKLHHLSHDVVTNNFGRLNEIYMYLTSGVVAGYIGFFSKINFINEHIFPMAHFANTLMFFLFGLVGIYFSLLIEVISPLYVIIGVFGIRKKFTGENADVWLARVGFIVVSIILTFSFLLQRFFLAQRYLALLAFLLLMGVPFVLDRLYVKWRKREGRFLGSRLFFPLIALCIFLIAISSVTYFGPAKTYIVKAGAWLNKNIPSKAAFCQNDMVIDYYAAKKSAITLSFDAIVSNPSILNQCDYLAMTFGRHEKKQVIQLREIINQAPLQLFKNKSSGQVVIYQIKKRDNVQKR